MTGLFLLGLISQELVGQYAHQAGLPASD